MSDSLTPNAVQLIRRSQASSPVVVQVVEIEKLSSSPETFRLLISDSVNAVWAVLTPKMNEICKLKKFNKGDVIQITGSKLGERGICFVRELHVMVPELGIIGSPRLSSTNLPRVDSAGLPVVMISDLTLNSQNSSIKARVTTKSSIRLCAPDKMRRQFFNFELIGFNRSEIRVTAFDNLADEFHETVELEGVFLISRFDVKPVVQEFHNLPNAVEIILSSRSTIINCVDNGSFPRKMWTFSPVSVVRTADVGSLVHILGTVISVGRYKFTRSSGSQRELSMRDAGEPAVTVFLWGNEFKQIGNSLEAIINLGRHPTVSITQAKVSLHDDQQVAGTLTSSFVKIDPYASNASSSFDSNLGAITVMPNANRKTVLEIIGNLGKYFMPEYVTVEAKISKFKDGPEDSYYEICTLCESKAEICRRMVCNVCGRQVSSRGYRYHLQFQIEDTTAKGDFWVSAFDECGTQIMGITAAGIAALDQGTRSELLKSKESCTYVFRLKIKEFRSGAMLMVTAFMADRDWARYTSQV